MILEVLFLDFQGKHWEKNYILPVKSKATNLTQTACSHSFLDPETFLLIFSLWCWKACNAHERLAVRACLSLSDFLSSPGSSWSANWHSRSSLRFSPIPGSCLKWSQSCPNLCDPMDRSPQAPWSMGFSRHEYWSGLLFPSPGESSWPRDLTQVSHIVGKHFTIWATKEAPCQHVTRLDIDPREKLTFLEVPACAIPQSLERACSPHRVMFCLWSSVPTMIPQKTEMYEVHMHAL